jgi:hypothetical protein
MKIGIKQNFYLSNLNIQLSESPRWNPIYF